jgi:hypothetical protein
MAQKDLMLDVSMDVDHPVSSIEDTYVPIYKNLHAIVQKSSILRYFFSRASFSKRVKMYWLSAEGLKAQPEHAVCLFFRLVANRMQEEESGEIPKIYCALQQTPVQMVLLMLIAIHMKYEFANATPSSKIIHRRTDGLPELDLGMEPVGLLCQCNGAPPISSQYRSRISMFCAECGLPYPWWAYCFSVPVVAAEQRRRCAMCAKFTSVFHRARVMEYYPEYEEEMSQAILMLEAGSNTGTMDVVISTVPPTTCGNGSFDYRPSPKRSRSSHYVVIGAQAWLKVLNSGSSPIDFSFLTFWRHSDGRTWNPFSEGQNIVFSSPLEHSVQPYSVSSETPEFPVSCPAFYCAQYPSSSMLVPIVSGDRDVLPFVARWIFLAFKSTLENPLDRVFVLVRVRSFVVYS